MLYIYGTEYSMDEARDREFATELHDVKEFLYEYVHMRHIAVNKRACDTLACIFFEKWETKFRAESEANRLCDRYHEAKQIAYAHPSEKNLEYLEFMRDTVQATVRWYL